jgi:hypothetical protein
VTDLQQPDHAQGPVRNFRGDLRESQPGPGGPRLAGAAAFAPRCQRSGSAMVSPTSEPSRVNALSAPGQRPSSLVMAIPGPAPLAFRGSVGPPLPRALGTRWAVRSRPPGPGSAVTKSSLATSLAYAFSLLTTAFCARIMNLPDQRRSQGQRVSGGVRGAVLPVDPVAGQVEARSPPRPWPVRPACCGFCWSGAPCGCPASR